MILVFANIKNIYYADYQYFLYNAKNKRFSPSKDNASANTVCFCSQDSLFVDFIHIYRRGVIYPKNSKFAICIAINKDIASNNKFIYLEK